MAQTNAGMDSSKQGTVIPTAAVSWITPDEVRWGSGSDSGHAARIVDSIMQQHTGPMEELKDGHLESWVKWIQAKLVGHSKNYKIGAFGESIKRTAPVAKILNQLIGSSLTDSNEKEVLRRGLKIFLEVQSRLEASSQCLKHFHSILLSGLYEEKVFVIFSMTCC